MEMRRHKISPTLKSYIVLNMKTKQNFQTNMYSSTKISKDRDRESKSALMAPSQCWLNWVASQIALNV